jgi:acetyltransferase-like isoleucine patch superfamily enzyme
VADHEYVTTVEERVAAGLPCGPARRETTWEAVEAGRLRNPATWPRLARRFIETCHESDTSVVRSLLGLAFYRAHGRWIWAHQGTRIRGLENLHTGGLLKIGIDYADISHPDDRTWLRLDGEMAVGRRCKIGRGSRIHVARGAAITWADGVWTNANVLIHIANGFVVGRDCLLGWGSQFVDDNFHEVDYEGRRHAATGAPIRIGDHVLIGNRASIGPGVEIGDGCVVASGSIVTRPHPDPDCLIAGSPAKVVRRGISWR